MSKARGAITDTSLARAIASALSSSGLLAASAAGMALSPTAFAATFQVTNNLDSGSGSLRDAIMQANANPDADTITFSSNVTGTITLTTGSLEIYYPVAIQGPGAGTLTISGGAQVTRPAAYSNSVGSVFIIGHGEGGGQPPRPAAPAALPPVTFSGLTITGGAAAKGGGIYAYYAAVTVDNCVVTNNYAQTSGGGIAVAGDNSTLTVTNSTISANNTYGIGGGITMLDYSAATISRSTISNNSAYLVGGGIGTQLASITIQQSTITDNSAGGGGGVFVHNDNSNALSIVDSTVSGNSATGTGYYYGGTGGGVYARHVSASITNSTIASNTAATLGGGVVSHIDDNGYYAATLANSTVSGNSASQGGGLAQTDSGVITLTNSVIGGNSATTDPDTYTYSAGSIAASFSLIGNSGAANISNNGGNLLNVAPQLGALTSNGGPTQTMLPLSGSPLINAGDPAFSGLSNDQRGAGFPRIVNGRVDIGAVESNGSAVAATPVPTPSLGLGGKLGLGALLGLAGLAVTRRRRAMGKTAGIMLAASLAMSAPLASRAAQGGHETRHLTATTIARYTVQGKIVTIVLGDGQTLTVDKAHLLIRDWRSGAARHRMENASTIAKDAPAAVRYETGRKGNTGIVRIRLTDTLQQAQAFIANKH